MENTKWISIPYEEYQDIQKLKEENEKLKNHQVESKTGFEDLKLRIEDQNIKLSLIDDVIRDDYMSQRDELAKKDAILRRIGGIILSDDKQSHKLNLIKSDLIKNDIV